MDQHIYNETLKDKFTLSPLQKYKKYNRWPHKLMILCLLIFLTSLQAIYVSTEFAYHNPNQMQAWASFFLSEDVEGDSIILYKVTEFQDQMKYALENLQNLQDISIQEIDMSQNQTTIHINYLYPYLMYQNGYQLSYEIKNYQGYFIFFQLFQLELKEPFDLDDISSIKNFLQEINSFQLEINNIKLVQNSVCWTIRINYNYQDYGYIVANIYSLGVKCEKSTIGSEDQYSFRYFFLPFSIFILAIIDIILNTKYIYEVIGLYTKNIYHQKRFGKLKVPRQKLVNDENLKTLKIILAEQKPWDRLTVQEKLLFFDLYLPLRILGDTFTVIGSGFIITQGFARSEDLLNYDQLFIGLGVFLSWFCLAKYLEYNQDLHLISSVLESSVIPLSLAILNFLPVFMAYALCGMCLFNESSRFCNLHNAITSLVALIYGDSVSDIISDTSKDTQLGFVLLYIVTYLLFFIFAVNSVMVALVREQQDERKLVIQREIQLMNELDINQSQQRLPTSKVKSLDESVNLNSLKEAELEEFKDSTKKQLALSSVEKLAQILKKKELSKSTIKGKWDQINNQEEQKKIIHREMYQKIKIIKDVLFDLEQELWNEIDYYKIGGENRKEVVQEYYTLLCDLNLKLKTIYEKASQIEENWNNARESFAYKSQKK